VKPFAQVVRSSRRTLDYARYMAGDFIDSGERQQGCRDCARRGPHAARERKNDRGLSHEHGDLHAHSAVCTHLGCNVHFNAAEKNLGLPSTAAALDIHGQVSTAAREAAGAGDRRATS